MPTIFTVSFTITAWTAQQDIFSWKALDDAPLTLLACFLSNTGIAADAGDASEELYGIEICQGNTTIGSGGSNPVGRKVRSKDSTPIPTTNLRANDTTKLTGGTRLLLHADGFNTRSGWQYQPTPECQFTFDEGDGFGAIQLMTTPSDSINFSGVAYLSQG